ncbi:hypothetical protein [Lysinibacillus sp. LZ02]|uniref:hypothetical protein n=1 Tax=Lysinibacillus sp. LZ02 TaxID=3420668 RepID=UPI003D36A171
MNKFKGEQRQIFGQLRLSDERKERVIQAVPKKRRNWVPSVIVASIAVICLFFAINGFQSNDDFTKASAIEAYETFLKEQRNDMEVDIEHVELPFERNNDAIIIGIYEQEVGDVYYIQHMTFENGQWTFGLAGGVSPPSTGEVDEAYSVRINYEDYMQDSDVMFAGILADDVESIVVGDQEVKTYTIDGDHVWVTLANSRGTPVYTVKDGEKKRITQYSHREVAMEPPMPRVYELVGDDYTLRYTKDTMHVYGEEYTEFDIIIDPDYYTKNPINYPDVVLVEGADGPEVVRIQATNDMSSQEVSIKVQESSIIINDMGILEPYGWARAKGNIDYKVHGSIDYGVMGEDELFVYPDNWLSEGVRGYIQKDQILGKVLGYSIASVDEQWSAAEVEVYKKVKQEGAAILADASPQEVARIQLYALLQEDYQTAHLLTEGISYEHMVNYFNEIKDQYLHPFIRYYAYMIRKSTFDEERNRLIVKSNTSDEALFTWEMARNDGWKVKFKSMAF